MVEYIGPSLVSFAMIFEALQSELFKLKFQRLSSQILKNPEFNLFMDGESSSSAQEQRISCELHLEPVANVPEEQAVDCTCYSEAECTG